MTNHLRYLLLAALTMVCGSMFAQESTATWKGAESSALPTEIGDDITLTWLESTGDQAPSFNSTKEAASMKKNNKLTIAGADANVTISEIVFTFDNSSDPGLSANAGNTTSNYTANTTTWTGEANSITFTAGSSRLIKSIKVTYTGKAAVVDKVPELAIIKVDNFNTTYDMDATDNKTLVVYYKNTGKAAAENAKLTLFVDEAENKVVTIGKIAAGATDGWKNVSYDLTKIEAGEHVVYVALTADGVEAVKSEQKTVAFTKKAAEATFTVTAPATLTVAYGATSFDIEATVKNTSETVDATDVVITLWNNGTVDTKTIASLAHGAEAKVTFTVAAPEGGFTPGTKSYYVQAPKNQSMATVEVTFEEAPIAEVKDLAITGIDGTIDLGAESSMIRVSVQNNGTVDIEEAPVTLMSGSKTLGSAFVTASAEKTGWCNVSVPSEGLTPGELEVTATVTVEGDATPEDNTMTKTLTVEAAEVPEPVFEVTVPDYEFILDESTDYSITVTVNNASEVDATNVEVKLLYGTMELAKKTVDAFPPYSSQKVTFTLPENMKAMLATLLGDAESKTIEVQAVVGKYSDFFNITLSKPFVPVYDMAVIAIQGELNMGNDNNTLTVYFENKGNVDIENAVGFLFYGEKDNVSNQKMKLIENFSVKAGAMVSKVVSFLPQDLKAGELYVKAQVTIDQEDIDPSNNEMEMTFTVKDVPVAKPTFSITAENVSVPFGSESFDIVAAVKNTSEVDAEKADVRLYLGSEIVQTKTIATLAAGAETTVTFTVSDILEPGKTATYYVVTDYGMATVTVTFEEEPVKPVVDLAITAIQGELDLSVETCYLTVFVDNLGTVDMTDATVTLKAGDKVIGTGKVSAKAGSENNMCTITIATADLTEGELAVTATVEAEGDVDLNNNELTHTFNVATAIQAIRAKYGENVKIFTLSGKKVNDVRRGQVYIINGKKMMVK